jgi:hypothetical protein
MIEDFIYSFLIVLAEMQVIENLTVKDKILKDLIESEEDFNHIKLQYGKTEWMFALPQAELSNQVVAKEIDILTYL